MSHFETYGLTGVFIERVFRMSHFETYGLTCIFAVVLKVPSRNRVNI